MDDKRTIAWFSAFIVVVLLAGVASGILLDRFLIRPPQRPGRPGPAMGGAGWMRPGGMRQGPPGPDGMRGGGRGMLPEALTERLSADLELKPAQKEHVAGILARRRTRLEEIRRDFQGRMQQEQTDLRAEIRALLDEKQQKRFDETVTTTPGLGGRQGQRR